MKYTPLPIFILLHGPTSPLRWGPLCNNNVDFIASTKGAGCLHLGFEYDKKDDKSLDSIDPSSVLNVIEEKINQIL